MPGTDRDTIAAISTAPGAAGIGIVRISGPAAVPVADRIFRATNGRPLAEAASHTVQYGMIEDGGEPLDEVLVSVLLAPRSYTRQDTVEINCHGGILVMRRVLQAVLTAGARLAEPGEFTKRAFLSGRIDLSQAEAVMDLIASENASAAKSALSQLGGAVRRRVEALRAGVLEETARVEAALDDPEHYDLAEARPEIEARLKALQADLQALLLRAEEGRIIRDGVATVILGRPNVGKSTLLNLLAGAERAIVTEMAGTTRDVLEEQVVLGGVPLLLRDTAGLRDSADAVEQIGVERARTAAEEADLILYVLDGSQSLAEQDRTNLQALQEKTVFLVRNKADLRQQLSDEEAKSLCPGAPLLSLSALDGQGVEALAAAVRERFLTGEVTAAGEPLLTNLRHKEALEEAAEGIANALDSLQNGQPEDLLAVDLMAAYAALSRITGEDVGEDLIDEIFSKFCLGK